MTTTTLENNNNSDKERRQIRPGLEIDTTKNNAFFSMSTTSTPRPPPSVSRKISIKQTPTTPTTTSIPPQEDDDDLFHHDSYANRLRNLVSRLHDEPNTPTPLDQLPTPIIAPPQTTPTIFLPHQKDLMGQQIGSFRILRLLGVGAFSKVYLGQHVDTSQIYAIKVILKSLMEDSGVRSSIERETTILKNIDHPNIVHIEAILETDDMMCIVLEYVQGGELFEAVKYSRMDEHKVKHLFLQLVRSVQWLHEHNIVHRDLKLENILIQKDPDTIKITDFGLARIIDPENPLLVTRCGSEEYAAPEIIQQQHYDGRKTDVWALGIILYALLVGYLPFRYDPRKQERVSQLFYRIVRAEIKWPKDTQVSDDAKFVVESILTTKPENRISIQDIEKLPWFVIG